MSGMRSLMKIDQENCIQTRNHATRIARLVDRDFDLLRVRVWERSDWIVRMHRVQETAIIVIAILLGSVLGWVVMR